MLLSHFDHQLPFNWYSADIEVQKLDVLSWISALGMCAYLVIQIEGWQARLRPTQLVAVRALGSGPDHRRGASPGGADSGRPHEQVRVSGGAVRRGGGGAIAGAGTAAGTGQGSSGDYRGTQRQESHGASGGGPGAGTRSWPGRAQGARNPKVRRSARIRSKSATGPATQDARIHA